ncbi:hypothetical protein A9F13_05g03245 [Clavispora lusitaniae]|uniref:Uncharacterized protein n=1 Tax=Clavispora lusitaniae TaxID=36911 RepID=A0AA91Q1C2_CLALS|nr:hypothetical protein A9F13_05g03245 [Clavispora lusitaniae]
MSIADVSKTLGGLAEAIHKKSAELEALEKEYKRKLVLLNSYIGKLEAGTGSQDQEAPEKTEEEIVRLLETPVRCKNCSNVVYDPNSECDYVLIPKTRVNILQDAKLGQDSTTETVKTEEIIKDKDPTETEENHKLPGFSSDNKHRKSKSKKTCSYCNKAGHSRARCFSRLSKPIE